MSGQKRVLVLDNYDSFTYNLVHYIEGILGEKTDVRRNDAIMLDEVSAYTHIVLSPGPGLPADAGIMPALIRRYAPHKPILGICLGHQAIAEAFGSSLYNLDKVYHGVATPVTVDAAHPLFAALPGEIEVGRYHSWAVARHTLPECLSAIAHDEEGVIMGLQHKTYKVTGVQFHPESILTPNGYTIMQNWLLHC